VYRIIGRGVTADPHKFNGNGTESNSKGGAKRATSTAKEAHKGTIDTAYDYVDESSNLLFQVVRKKDPKGFFQRRPDGKGGWINNVRETRLVPYHLDEIANNPDQTTFVAEGEKDADRLRASGFAPATCNPMGAGQWQESYSKTLAGRDVVLFYDSDGPDKYAGQHHAARVARSLLHHDCTVRLVHLPAGAKDVSQFLEGEGTVETLTRLIDHARPLTSETLAEWSKHFQPATCESHPQNGAPAPPRDAESGLGKNAICDLLWQPYTDTGNAERLTLLHGRDIRFCVEKRSWAVWDGRRWNFRDKRHIKAFAKHTVRQMYAEASVIPDEERRKAAEKHARKSESAAAITNMLSCSEYETGVQVSSDDLDRHKFLLNVLNGTLDLQTGQLREHRREDLITKLVHVNYNPDAQCPRFLKFLERITGGGPDASEGDIDRADRLAKYLQKCFGYALTGDVSEKAVFCLFGLGEGNNGKTTLLEIIRFILAEYSSQILIETLMMAQARENSASLSDLADLRGARFVTTSEAEEGQRLAAGKLKYITQGMGDIKARRLYENMIIFPATHKLFVDANHKPIIRGVEKAVWNRLKPIPFTVTIPDKEIDKTLLEKLRTEAEGILAWLVQGCLLWQKEGLGTPPEVARASSVWQAESDRFPIFIEEKCVLAADPKACIPVSQLWPAYQTWCETNKEQSTLRKAAFDERLKALGCKPGVDTSGRVRVWKGIRFRTHRDPMSTPEIGEAERLAADLVG
jgi:putative DNA primase/helicase